jgi:uncharacterized membrane protein YsdA (DUF1294 family)
MKDDELEVWRRQWRGQPQVPIDLIRKVERQTVYARLGLFAHVLPLSIAIVATVGAFTNPNPLSILIASGFWFFILVTWVFSIRNSKGTWAPAAQTTAAYVELSIARCRSYIRSFRLTVIVSILVTVFVLVAVYEGLSSAGRLQTRESYEAVAFNFLWTISVMSFVVFVLDRKRRKTKIELDYLLDLQRKLENGQEHP